MSPSTLDAGLASTAECAMNGRKLAHGVVALNAW